MSEPVAYFETIEDVQAVSVMPSADVDLLERNEPGWILRRARILQARIDSQLSKRYAVPFEAPVPEIVLGWLGALLDPLLYRKRGVNPSDEQQTIIVDAAKEAISDLEKAANSVTGLFDLPLRADTVDSGIKQVVFADSHQSPWTWTDDQYDGRDH